VNGQEPELDPIDLSELDALETSGLPAEGELPESGPVERPTAEAEAAGSEPADEPADQHPDETDDELEDVEPLDDAQLDCALEALLLVVDEPADELSLAAAVVQPPERVIAALNRMAAAYTEAGRGIELRRIGEGWRVYNRDVYAPYVERLLREGQRAKLTRAALETLAVVAYRQPVTRAPVAAVRGVNSDGVMRTLLTRGLVEESGVDASTQGHLYRTTELFLERLGLSSLQELPSLAPLLPDVDAIDDV